MRRKKWVDDREKFTAASNKCLFQASARMPMATDQRRKCAFGRADCPTIGAHYAERSSGLKAETRRTALSRRASLSTRALNCRSLLTSATNGLSHARIEAVRCVGASSSTSSTDDRRKERSKSRSISVPLIQRACSDLPKDSCTHSSSGGGAFN